MLNEIEPLESNGLFFTKHTDVTCKIFRFLIELSKQRSVYIEGSCWAYKSKADIAKEIGVSESSIKRALTVT
jgi:hypothetical protein